MRVHSESVLAGGTVKSDALIGRVVAAFLHDRLGDSEGTGTARYLLDCFAPAQLTAIATAVLGDGDLDRQVEMRLPKHFLLDSGLPERVLTAERTTYWRNASFSKAILLVANTGDDEEQSLKELVPVGSQQLQADCDVWVRIAGAGLGLTDEHLKWWTRALKGLLDAKALPLERMADYVSETRRAIAEEGHPILHALGFALPALHVPRDSGCFSGMTVKTAMSVTKWRNLYATVFKKRACYLVKQTPAQGLLTEDDLATAFAKVRDSIPESAHATVEAFIHASSGWCTEAHALATTEWEQVKPLFDGLKREPFNLGKATAEFYDEAYPESLTADEADYLKRLTERKALDADEEDEDFYRRHRQELKEKPGLKARWDKFIYGMPVEADDFLAGLAECLESLFDQDQQSTKRKLCITSERRTKKDLKELNCDAGLYFAFRHKGLAKLFGRGCSWEMGELMNFPLLDQQWRAATKPYVNRSVARAALQLKFYVDLEVTLPQGNVETYSKQMIWTFNSASVNSELYADWLRLVDHPFLVCSATRELVNSKGRAQTIDLRDSRTLLPTFDKDRGSLIPAYKRERDIEVRWRQNLQMSLADGLVSAETHAKLNALFDAFTGAYRAAVVGLYDEGLACEGIVTQAAVFGDLLTYICREAKGDRNRAHLLRPLLELGSAPVYGGAVTTIIAPWHPLRLAAVGVKARYVAGLVRHLLAAESVLFGDTALYFEELVSELRHPFYPEVALGWLENRSELLSLSDHYLDYSLHESPIANAENYCDTNENPTGSADRVIELISRYLTLHPHEQANLSVVLYNCDSARLPQAIVDRLNDLHEDKEDMRCQVILRHRNAGKLRGLYEKIIEASDVNADSFVASEATRDFMARLRIGIMADQAPPPDAADGPPTDIVFLQDVIARHSRLEWYMEDARPEPIQTWIPPRWARRRPAATDDMKSVVYLCCPVASQEGWAYRTAITTFLKGDWDGNESRRLLPARQLDFNDPTTASIFKEIHNLGNWVVNYDELLDRRQLLNQSVKVIRFKQSDTQGRNILISSTAPLGLLKTMVLQRLRDLSLGLTQEEYQALTQQLIADANDVSGDLVLRAAKRGRNASELIGVVLSRFLIKKELGEAGRHFGWYFLDDYAGWLGQREEQIADIMCLSPEKAEDGSRRLAVVISEAKYIDHASLSTKAKESQKQLRQTMDRIGKALFGDPGRLDRDIWLSRFSDMVLSGIQFPATMDLGLSEWRRAIREGSCSIYLRGYSHVFVSGPADAPDASAKVVVADCDDAFQEIFSPTHLRALLLHYWRQSDPQGVRMDITAPVYRAPTERHDVGRPRVGRGAEKVEPAKTKPLEDQPKKETPPPTDTKQVTPGTGQPTEKKDARGNGTLWPWTAVGGALATHTFTDDDREEDQAWLTLTANAAKFALQQFQMNSKLLSCALTPNAALLKFQGSAHLTVEQVLKRRSEFLTTHKLNLVSVRAEPGMVSISVARQRRRTLQMEDCWTRWNPSCANGNTDLLAGVREEDGGLLLVSPVKNAPHTLIAGSTGSGKSVLMQNLILSMAATNTPDQLQLTLIDPKMGVDYFAFEPLPHLSGPIITEPEHAMQVLSGLVDEMNRRYALLKVNRVSSIIELRKMTGATEKPPILWVVHDEFAEWMMTDEYRDGVSNIVSRLGVKARAAGIFLIFAAQRPDANVMPMQLRSNLGNRLVLRVDGEGTSEIALGEKGAERLLGKGHLAAKLEGEDGIITGQVPLVASARIEAIVGGIAKEWESRGK
jgi:S-DNA-T family DNA segregation ATPase FtsK/SpoIIIE